MSFLEVRHVQKIYTTRFGGTKVQALSDVNFTVEKGEYVAIMGESGSGKTTLMKISAGLLQPTAGSVIIWMDIPPLSPARRRSSSTRSFCLSGSESARLFSRCGRNSHACS